MHCISLSLLGYCKPQQLVYTDNMKWIIVFAVFVILIIAGCISVDVNTGEGEQRKIDGIFNTDKGQDNEDIKEFNASGDHNHPNGVSD